MSFELERGGGRFKDRIVGFVFPNSIVSESGWNIVGFILVSRCGV